MSMDPREAQLDRLLQAYRHTNPDPEASANFMPELWARIDRSRSVPVWFRRMAQGFVTAAVALSLALFMMATGSEVRDNSDLYQRPYVEVLAAHHVITGEEVEPVANIDAGVEIDLL